jgi:two-component system phosphate regulon sensor histidine kinase PhoR
MIAEDIEKVELAEEYEELDPYIEAIRNQHEDVIQNALIRQEFTANVSHELKTPLTAISGYAELIENGMVSSEKETKRFAKEIHKNANRLLTLINDVIRLSELDGTNEEEFLEPVNLREIAENCVNMLQINAGKHDVSLEFVGEDVTIMATRQMAEEVLYNLCDNAIRYNQEGGSVQVSVKNRGNMAQLTVKDTGIGIPKEHQERLFERLQEEPVWD